MNPKPVSSERCTTCARRLAGADGSARAYSTLPLVTRLGSLVVLCAGSIWWMCSIQPAMGQFQSNPRYQNPPSGGLQGFAPNGTAGSFGGQNSSLGGQQTAIPSIPAAMGQPAGEADPGLAPEDGEGSEGRFGSFEMPAIIQKITQGGWLMVPLGICSLIVFSLSLERLIALRRSRVIPRPFVRRFTECVEDGQLSYDEATAICEEFDCPVAEVFQAAVRRWGRPMLEVEQAVMDAGDRVGDGLKRFLRVFHAISNVAPLLGLLGTVLGMIQAFEVMSNQEAMAGPESLASGISVALITTAGGLSVAIPAYLAYMYFSSKSDRYLGEIDKLCQRVVDCISAEGLEENSNASRTRKKRAA